jgi:hypothetical protein
LLDWAIGQLFLGRDRPDVARDLGVDRRTLDRRLAARRQEDRVELGHVPSTYRYRCPNCLAVVATPTCSVCNAVINALHILDVETSKTDFLDDETTIEAQRRHGRGRPRKVRLDADDQGA